MDWITDTIAIGNYVDAEDAELRRASGIRSMICLNGRLRGVQAEALELDALENYDLTDGPGNDIGIFQRAVQSVGRFSARYPKLLVQCHAGRSRSVVVVAAHLMLGRGLSDREALAFVASRRESALTAGIEKLLRSPFLYETRKA